MKLELLYKSYAAPGVSMKQGDTIEVGETDGKRMLHEFPGWFRRVDGRQEAQAARPEPSVSAVEYREVKPSDVKVKK